MLGPNALEPINLPFADNEERPHTMTLRLEPLSLEHLDGIMTWVNDPEVTFYSPAWARTSRRKKKRTSYPSSSSQTRISSTQYLKTIVMWVRSVFHRFTSSEWALRRHALSLGVGTRHRP